MKYQNNENSLGYGNNHYFGFWDVTSLRVFLQKSSMVKKSVNVRLSPLKCDLYF